LSPVAGGRGLPPGGGDLGPTPPQRSPRYAGTPRPHLPGRISRRQTPGRRVGSGTRLQVGWRSGRLDGVRRASALRLFLPARSLSTAQFRRQQVVGGTSVERRQGGRAVGKEVRWRGLAHVGTWSLGGGPPPGSRPGWQPSLAFIVRGGWPEAGWKIRSIGNWFVVLPGAPNGLPGPPPRGRSAPPAPCRGCRSSPFTSAGSALDSASKRQRTRTGTGCPNNGEKLSTGCGGLRHPRAARSKSWPPFRFGAYDGKLESYVGSGEYRGYSFAYGAARWHGGQALGRRLSCSWAGVECLRGRSLRETRAQRACLPACFTCLPPRAGAAGSLWNPFRSLSAPAVRRAPRAG